MDGIPNKTRYYKRHEIIESCKRMDRREKVFKQLLGTVTTVTE